MFRVINSLVPEKKALQSVTKLSEKLGPGLLVTIDVKQSLDREGKPAFLVEPGSTVRIRRPDGSLIHRRVTGVVVWGAERGIIFFEDGAG